MLTLHLVRHAETACSADGRYCGYCTDRQHVEHALRRFAEARPGILGHIETVPGLSERMRGVAQRFVERYYKLAARGPKQFERSCLSHNET